VVPRGVGRGGDEVKRDIKRILLTRTNYLWGRGSLITEKEGGQSGRIL